MKPTTIALSAALCAVTLLGGAAAYQAWRYRTIALDTGTLAASLSAERDQISAELDAVNLAMEAADRIDIEIHRQIVMRDAGLTDNGAAVESARAIRDWVYRTNKVGQGADHAWNHGLIYAHLGKSGHEQICGGMSAAYYWALTAVGIPSRIVQLASQDYLSGDDAGGTHVTVEAYIDGQWRVSDPTFNAEFTCSAGDEALSITGMRQCLAEGGDLIPVPGQSQIEGRTVAEYYLPYEQLLAAYARTPVDTEQVRAPAEQAPPGWMHNEEGFIASAGSKPL